MTFLVLHLATVDTALNNLYQNYLKLWAPAIAIVVVAAGGIVWMLGTIGGNAQAGAHGIRVAVIAIIGLAVVLGAASIVGIAKSLGL